MQKALDLLENLVSNLKNQVEENLKKFRSVDATLKCLSKSP